MEYVYLLRRIDGPGVKIGTTIHSGEDRRREAERSYSCKFTLEHTIAVPRGRALEQAIHAALHPFRIERELYDVPPDALDVLLSTSEVGDDFGEFVDRVWRAAGSPEIPERGVRYVAQIVLSPELYLRYQAVAFRRKFEKAPGPSSLSAICADVLAAHIDELEDELEQWESFRVREGLGR